MLIMTKKTLITYVDESNQTRQTPALAEARNNKFSAMQALGQTDGYHVESAPNVWTRHWIDQAAAEEWVEAVVEMTQPYGNIIASTDIADLV